MQNRDLNLRKIGEPFKAKLAKIKVALFDVDGILTNGHIYFQGGEIGFNRFFHVQDGYGLKLLMDAGIKVGIITGGDSVGVKKRFELLDVDYLYTGNEDKRAAFNDIVKQTGAKDDEILYMGDEFFDLPLLKRSGFSATVPHSSLEIREQVDYVTYREGGEGAVREVIDMLRYAQNIEPKITGF
ncbi:MAG: HAD hydrolase family protein [Bacteriovoracaceae bacterium]|nr:HAD hydrolase family protein [Bacteriovoracaceae bacterium]